MKVLYANTLYPTGTQPLAKGGAETFAVRFCEELVKRGHDVTVLRSGPVGKTWPPEITTGPTVRTVPLFNLYDPWRDRPQNAAKRIAWHFIEDQVGPGSHISQIIKETAPDIIHTNSLIGITTEIWSQAAKLNVPIVHTIHDYYLTCVKAQRFKDGHRCRETCSACRFLTKRRRRRSRDVDCVVGVSKTILDIHQDNRLFLSDTETYVVRNTPPIVQLNDSDIYCGGEKIRFGYIGNISINKGALALMEAFSQLPVGLATLTLAGTVSDDLKEKLSRLLEREDVTYLGVVQADLFFRSVHVTIVPSIWDDPSPMVLGESLAFGRPVIGSRRGGIPEIISDDVGWLYDPDADDLSDLILRVISDRRGAMSRASNALLLSKTGTTFSDQVDQYENIYRLTSKRDN